MRKLLLVLCMTALTFSGAHAQEVSKTVTLTEAGTLEATLGDEIGNITNLTVNGPMNNDDMSLFKTSGSSWRPTPAKMAKLDYLDLSGVTSLPSLDYYADDGTSFNNVKQLKKVTLPKIVKSIDQLAFFNAKVDTVVVSEGTTKIGEKAFQQCKIKSISLPSTLQSIGANAFQGCSSMEKFTIPSGLMIIGDNAFQSCSKLTEIDVDPKNRFYSAVDGMIYYNYMDYKILYFVNPNFNEENLVIADGTQALMNNLFKGKTCLKSVTFPSSLKSIGQYAFQSCKNLTTVNFNEGLEEIGGYAFSMCSNLTEIKLPQSLKTLGRLAFEQIKGLSSIEIPGSVEEIGMKAFYMCENLKEVKLNEGLKSISRDAFSSTHITRIELPATLESFDRSGAFSFPYSVTDVDHVDVIVKGDSIPNIYSTSFSPSRGHDASSITLWVKKGTLDWWNAKAEKASLKYTIKENDPTGVKAVTANSATAKPVARYNALGAQVDENAKGIVIVKMSDGTTKKVLAK